MAAIKSELSYTNQLINLYLKWKEDPKLYQYDMAAAIDRIVYTTVRRMSKKCKITGIESQEDLIQDLRYTCLVALNKVQPPYTNKRIYNYLRYSVQGQILSKGKKLARFMDHEQNHVDMELIDHVEAEDKHVSIFNFGDPLTNQVATLLSDRVPRYKICEDLHITQTQLKKQINKIKDSLYEKNSF